MIQRKFKKNKSLSVRRRTNSSQQTCITQSNVMRKQENRLTRISLGIVSLYIACHFWRVVPTAYEALYSEDVNDVSVVFVNIVDFCKISNEISSHQVLRMLQSLFRRFDTISKKYNILKLDTIGDAYLCCSGLFKKASEGLEISK